MPQARTDTAMETTVGLGNDITINSAASLRQLLLDAIDSADCVVAEAAEGARADTAGLQLLLSARRFADSRGRRFVIGGPGLPSIKATADMAGIRLFDPS